MGLPWMARSWQQGMRSGGGSLASHAYDGHRTIELRITPFDCAASSLMSGPEIVWSLLLRKSGGQFDQGKLIGETVDDRKSDGDFGSVDLPL